MNLDAIWHAIANPNAALLSFLTFFLAYHSSALATRGRYASGQSTRQNRKPGWTMQPYLCIRGFWQAIIACPLRQASGLCHLSCPHFKHPAIVLSASSSSLLSHGWQLRRPSASRSSCLGLQLCGRDREYGSVDPAHLAPSCLRFLKGALRSRNMHFLCSWQLGAPSCSALWRLQAGCHVLCSVHGKGVGNPNYSLKRTAACRLR